MTATLPFLIINSKAFKNMQFKTILCKVTLSD